MTVEKGEILKRIWVNIRIPFIRKKFPYMVDLIPWDWRFYEEKPLTETMLYARNLWNYDQPFPKKQIF